MGHILRWVMTHMTHLMTHLFEPKTLIVVTTINRQEIVAGVPN